MSLARGFIATVLMFFATLAFADGPKRQYRGWGSDFYIDAQIIGMEINSKEKLLFLDLKDYYAVIELSQCSPDVRVNPKVKGTKIKGGIRFEYPGTIDGGPFYLADSTFCEVQITVSTSKQKQEWEQIFMPRIPKL